MISGIDVVDFLQFIAQRLADADRLAAEPGAEMAQRVVGRMSLLIRPVQADMPFAIALVTSFDQRSPQRFVVASAESARRHQPLRSPAPGR